MTAAALGLGWNLAAVGVLGTWVLLAGMAHPASLAAWRAGYSRTALWLACVSWMIGLAVFAQQAVTLVGGVADLSLDAVKLLATATRFGHVWLAKQLLLALMIGTWPRPPRLTSPATLILASLFIVSGLWAGHAGATTPLFLWFALHAVHALAASAWLGALPGWISLAVNVGDTVQHDYFARVVARFSRAATVAMGALLTTGIVIAVRQFERWPALFGTRAGLTLALKLSLLGGALYCALHVRRRFLAELRHAASPNHPRLAARSVRMEFVLAVGVLFAAYTLARMEPGAHQTIVWGWPWRFAPGPAWQTPLNAWLSVLGAAFLLAAIPGWRARFPRTALGAAVTGSLVIAYALAIPAYPDTYRRPTVTYTAESIVRGKTLFQTHCVSCHGPGARGAGSGGAPNALAADLSEHTALHTAGDMFWWLTHGTPSGLMPGFATTLNDTARWDLINFLRAFADGFRARVLTPTPVPAQAWLGAPNFVFEAARGVSAELKDWRERSAVLLVIAQWPQAAARLARLAEAAPALRQAGITLLTSLQGAPCAVLQAEAAEVGCLSVNVSVATTYSLFARTLAAPGARTALAPPMPHGEFLIDRYGFLRARWLPAQDGPAWTRLETVAELGRQLAAERRIAESPDEHVH